MISKHKSSDYKLTAVQYFLIGDKAQTDVCKIFKCSPRSLIRWVEKYEKDGEIKRHNRKPIAYKVHKEHVKFLLDMIKKNRTITMIDLMMKLKKDTNNLS
jgi:transposase